MRNDDLAMGFLAAIFVAAVIIIAGASVFLYIWRPSLGGCSRGLSIHATVMGTGSDAQNVPLYVIKDGLIIQTGKTDVVGRALFPTVPCGIIGLRWGGGSWVLSDPRSIDLNSYSSVTVQYDITVNPCSNQGGCGSP